MRRATIGVPFALATALALAAPALAEDAPKLPFDPFEKAEAGDFAVYSFKRTTDVKVEIKEGIIIVRVGKVDADSVHLLVDRTVASVKEGKTTPVLEGPIDLWLSRKGGVLLEDFHSILFFVHGQTKSVFDDLGDVTVSPETRQVCGKDAECKQVSSNETAMKTKLGMEGRKTRSFSLCADVKAIALAHAREDRTGLLSSTTELELLGHGTKGKAIWGKTPEEAEKASKAPRRKSEFDEKKGKGSTKLPFNPFARAEEGDYAVYVSKTTMTMPDMGNVPPEVKELTKGMLAGLTDHTDYLVVRVKMKEGDDVSLALDRTAGGAVAMGERETCSKKGDVILGAYLRVTGMVGFETIESAKISDEKRTIAGKPQDTKRVLVAGTTPSSPGLGGPDKGGGGERRAEIALNLLADSSPIGLAAASLASTSETKNGQIKIKIDYELVGYGTKGGSAWGKTIDEAVREAKANAAK